MLKYFFLFTWIFTFVLWGQQNHLKPVNIAKLESKAFENISAAAYPGDGSIDVTYYWLNIKLDYYQRVIGGFVQINFKSKVAQLNSFFIDLQDNLNLDSVLYKGKKISASHSNNKITVTLPVPLQKNYESSVRIFYHGIPGSSGFGSFEFEKHGNYPIIWSLSEPYGASDWFPCKDTPADKADSSDVWITADSFFVSVSNGSLLGVVNNGDGTKTYKWKNSYPISQYLISLAMTNYKEYDVYFKYLPDDSMVVRNFIYPEHFTEKIKAEFKHTANMLKVYSDLFGLYPFVKEKYGHAEFGWSGGMEHQTITSLGTNYDSPYFSDHLISHELAHQWFGDKITCKDWHNIWLNEGFASYCEALYSEKTYGKNAYNQEINYDMSVAKGAVGSIWVQDISSVGQIFDYARSYKKAAVVLHMLRGILGDSLFFKALFNYANAPNLAYGVAVTEDFQKVVESTSNMDLNYFFKEWIYGEKYPVYSVKWGFNKINGELYNVNITINQTKMTNPEYFAMPVKIRIKTTLQDTLFNLFNEALPSQSFQVEVKGKPTDLYFDDGNWILKNVSSVVLTDVKKVNPFPKKFELKQNFPNPFNPATTIEFSVPEIEINKNVSLKVYDTGGREVAILFNKKVTPGIYKAEFFAKGLSSGVYFYTLKIGNKILTKKMVLLK